MKRPVNEIQMAEADNFYLFQAHIYDGSHSTPKTTPRLH
jgi:hypothetical protein